MKKDEEQAPPPPSNDTGATQDARLVIWSATSGAERGGSRADRRLRRAFLAIALYATLLAVWLLARPGGASLVDAVDGLCQLLAPLIGIVLCFWDGIAMRPLTLPAQVATGSRRWIPLIAATALSTVVIGQIILLVIYIIPARPIPQPSAADAFFLSAYILFLIVALLLPSQRLAFTLRLRTLLDGLLILVAMLTCAWPLTVGPLVLAAHISPLSRVVSAAYPLGDSLILACAILMWMQDHAHSQRPVLAIASVALGAAAISDSAANYLSLHGASTYGTVLDVGWPVAVLLAGLSVSVLRHLETTSESSLCRDRGASHAETDAMPSLRRMLLPYVPLPLVAVLAYSTWWFGAGSHLVGGVIVGTCTLVVLVVVRQIVALFDNRRLHNSLLAGERREQERALAAEAMAAQLAARQARLTALQRITGKLAGVRTPDEIVRAVVGESPSLFNAAVCTIRVLSADGAWLERLVSLDDTQAALFADRLPINRHSPLVEAARTGRSVWLESEGEALARYPEAVSPHIQAGFRATAIVPLLIEGKTIGTLALTFPYRRRFELEEKEFLQTLAEMTAQALDRARLYVYERERAAAAEELARMRGDFVASVSHELRTPLTAIVGYGELLDAHWHVLGEAARREHVRRIVLSANRQKKLVEDLLLVSRLDSEALSIECAPAGLVALVVQAAEEVRSSYAGQRIDTGGPDGILVLADPGRVVQVLVNLMDNAAKYSPEGSPLVVEWESTCTQAIVRVHDHGPGIDEVGRHRLFTRFGRIPGSRIRSGRVGTGLGLYLGRRFALAMGGELDLERSGRDGSTFRLRLPLASGAGVAVERDVVSAAG